MLYMNNTGHRWTYREKTPRAFYLLQRNGTYKLRHTEFFEAVGNFVAYAFKYQGARIFKFPEFCETHKGLPVIKII